MFESLVVVSPVEIIRQCDGKILPRPGRLAQDHDPVGVRVWKRPKQNRVNDAEDGGVRADPECEGDDCDGRESWIFDQLPKCETEIIHNGVRSLDRPSWRAAREQNRKLPRPLLAAPRPQNKSLDRGR